jgi:hypothetical protein
MPRTLSNFLFQTQKPQLQLITNHVDSRQPKKNTKNIHQEPIQQLVISTTPD